MNKYSLLLSAALLCTGLQAHAGCMGVIANGSCIGAEIDHPQAGTRPSSSQPAYQGSSGTGYQYDLNQPTDRLRHATDLDAQTRDQMSLQPGRSLDRGLGQQGGGIYGD